MTTPLILAATLLGITAMLTLAAARAWRGWLELKRIELACRTTPAETQEGDAGLRIELAAVRERLKRLEAIASGVEL